MRTPPARAKGHAITTTSDSRPRRLTLGAVRDVVTLAWLTETVPTVAVGSRPCHGRPAADDGSWPTCVGVGQDGHLAAGVESLHALASPPGTPCLLRDADLIETDATLVLTLPHDPERAPGHELPRPGPESWYLDGDLLAVRVDLVASEAR